MKYISSALLLLALNMSTAQEEFTYESECPNVFRFFHHSPDEGSVAILYEYCNEIDTRVLICKPQNEQLVTQLTFEFEYPDGLFSTDSGFYLISRNSEEYFIRFIDNSLNVSGEVVLDLNVASDIKEIYVDNGNLVIAYFRQISFYIERFDMASGSLLETISFTGFPSFVYDFQTSMVVLDAETVYVGLLCGWIFKFNPMNLAATELLPLPYNEEAGGDYIPCSNIEDALRPNPADNILFTASSFVLHEDFYSFNFGYNGEHLGTDHILFPEEYTLRDFTFDDFGNKYLFYDLSFDEDLNEYGIFKINVVNEITDTLILGNLDAHSAGYLIRLINDELHLYGSKWFNDNPDNKVSSYIRVNTNDFGTGITQLPAERLAFIQTQEVFGVKPTNGFLKQEVFNLTGALHRSSEHPTLWRKSDFAPGSYALRVHTSNGIFSYLVVVY